MAKTARKAKARSKSREKSRSKPKARSARKIQKKVAPRKEAVRKTPPAKAGKAAATAGNVPRAAVAEPKPGTTFTLPLSVDSPRQKAVTKCVNGYMNRQHKGWDADGNGNNKHLKTGESPLMLARVQGCLEPKHYKFAITPELVHACEAGSISDIKYEIYEVTKAT